jgi:F-type H+-transporting ATPase subunit b
MGHAAPQTERMRWRSLAGVVLAIAAPAAASETGSFYPGDLGHAIATLVIFVLLLVVLGKWAWRPIVTQLRQREQGLAESLDRAEAREQESQELLRLYRSRLDAAESEAKKVLVGAHRDAAAAREQLLAQARQEAQVLTERAREEIERATQAAMTELRQTTAELAAQIAEELIRTQCSPADHQRLVSQSLREIGQYLEEDA